MSRVVFFAEPIASVPTPGSGFARLLFDNTYGTAKPVLRWKYDDGTVGTALAQKGRLFVNPITDYGCKFDHRVVFDGATTGGTSVITSATASFTAADIGKRIVLTGAGAGASPNTAMYVGSITSLNSSSSVNVSPATTTTVSAKGLQIHTDDLTAWTNLINDINNSPYPGAVVQMEAAQINAFGTSGFTNRSGVSAFLPQITKQVRFEGIAGGHNADIGDYTKAGGSCIAYVGTTVDSGVPFGALMTIAPSVGIANQALKQVTVSHFWLDCRNGDGAAALKGFRMLSCHGPILEDLFVMDAGAIAYHFGVVGPGLAVPNAGSLGEAKDFTRGTMKNISARLIDPPAIGVTTTPTTTTSAITLSAVGQSLVLAAANGLTTSGYVWVMTTLGIPVLVNYTGGGGTTTLTGCTVDATDAAAAAYTTVSGSFVVQAFPGNACAMMMDGDATANTCLHHIDTFVVSHGTTWGPAAMEYRDCDSMDVQNPVINGGNNTNDGAINRIRKPGVRLNGHSVSTLHARNNVFRGGTAGVGGCSQMGVSNTGALLNPQAQANHWYDYQLANGESLPTVEGNSFFLWNPNGAMGLPLAPAAVAVVDQAIAAATLTLITGSVLAVPPQGFQIGTCLRWVIEGTSAAVGTAANTINVRLGTTGTSADAVVAAFTTGVGNATAAPFRIEIGLTIRTLGAAATAISYCVIASGLLGVADGLIAQLSNMIQGVMSTFNTTTIQQFFSVSITTGASKTLTVQRCLCEVVKPANP